MKINSPCLPWSALMILLVTIGSSFTGLTFAAPVPAHQVGSPISTRITLVDNSIKACLPVVTPVFFKRELPTPSTSVEGFEVETDSENGGDFGSSNQMMTGNPNGDVLEREKRVLPSTTTYTTQEEDDYESDASSVEFSKRRMIVYGKTRFVSPAYLTKRDLLFNTANTIAITDTTPEEDDSESGESSVELSKRRMVVYAKARFVNPVYLTKRDLPITIIPEVESEAGEGTV
ncbi:hypothetical protein BGZ96_011464 [Linnemannia gamsii]|uniref:Uncharacterized protein n=1 Tax=Linnemannia gamsii TaxID=64522 RepID=A0ABQ7JSU8_9FUNG|nr:hypothetical protein BGZ96_011464 [Linnemannia gamsii]